VGGMLRLWDWYRLSFCHIFSHTYIKNSYSSQAYPQPQSTPAVNETTSRLGKKILCGSTTHTMPPDKKGFKGMNCQWHVLVSGPPTSVKTA
jgi:hypothetical protein